MEEKVHKTIDVRHACCYSTLVAPIKTAIKTTKSDEILEIVANSDLKEEIDRIVKEEGYRVIGETEKGDELSLRIRR